MDKPELSTLLKLKRYERPAPEFWDAFDAKLHQRTLKTLVEKTSLRSRMYLKIKSALYPITGLTAAAAAAIAIYISIPTAPVSSETTLQAEYIPVEPAPADLNFVMNDAEAHFANDTISAPATDNEYYTTVAAKQAIKAGDIIPEAAEQLTSADEAYYLASSMTIGNSVDFSSTPMFGL